MMSEIANDPHFAACYHLLPTCFPDLESGNLKSLVLIPSCLARDVLSCFAARTRHSAAFPLLIRLRSPG
jgi:hypothetical protein